MKLRILRLHSLSPNNVNGKKEKAINEQQKNKLKNISISKSQMLNPNGIILITLIHHFTIVENC